MSDYNTRKLSDPENGQHPPARTRVLMLVLCLVIIAAGALGAVVLIRTAPKSQKRPPRQLAPLVSVQKVFPDTRQVVVQAMGNVRPERDLTLKSRVAGEIIHLHPEFTEGGIIGKGELMLRIDDEDYRLLVAQKQRAVADADYNLKLELGRQDIARHEWALLNGGNPDPGADADLALRKPHLEKARSDLAGARAELRAAQLQLERTKICAPFNAIVRSTLVEKGSQVAVQETLATLAGTDEYWVQASVPVDRLQWIRIPDDHRQTGARAEIIYQGGARRQGRVKKLLSDLETEGRMARLVIAVSDPLSLKASAKDRPAMIIGEYVRVEIQGRKIEGAFRLPRAALRDNAHVWVAGKDDRLEIREVRTVWRDMHTVLLKEGLQPGDRVIVSDLAAPVPGMAIEIEGAAPQPITPADNQVADSIKG
ncbi:MAG: efflux RND transporter periplasmic adaptor subunit [Desulfobacteraceae bacterium]